MSADLDSARTVADAVLYEGYLLYPYRASSSKNQIRWQFGVLGPPAAEPGIGELPTLSAECLLADTGSDEDSITVYLRFLQLQSRTVLDRAAQRVEELTLGDRSWLSWEEAVPREIELGPFSMRMLAGGFAVPVEIPGGTEREPLLHHDEPAGELIRERLPLAAELVLSVVHDGAVRRLGIQLSNTSDATVADRDAAIARSLLGSHLLVQAHGTRFISLLEPPDEFAEAAGRCRNARCWPVLASAADDLLLVSPIIVYDHPQVAPQSAGALFDSTEIDEILTLRVMTLTDKEKAEARATDPQAAAIIDRCDAMTADELQRLHGVLRDPHALDGSPAFGGPTGFDDLAAGFDDFPVSIFSDAVPTFSDAVPTFSDSGGKPWWDPGVDAAVSPETDEVLIGGVSVHKGSLVRVRPLRRADAQDLFFAGQQAKVTAVFADVDGNSHVAVVLVDDPAADLHEWYGRYLYFAPDELEPLPDQQGPVPDDDVERRVE